MSKCLLGLVTLMLFTNAAVGQATGDFRTFATGQWNDVNTWERFDGTTWINPAPNTPTSASGAITIRNAHTVTVTADVTIDQTTVQFGGVLQVGPLFTLTIADGTGDDLSNDGTFTLQDDAFFDGSVVNVNGQLNNTSTINIDNSLSSLNFLPGSLYRHARDGGTVPLSNWNASSSCEISGVTGNAPGQTNQNFGNFNWNCPGQTGNITLVFAGTVNLGGSINISNTGSPVSRLLIFSNTNGTVINITGDFNVTNAARFAVTQTGNPVTLNVTGNYVHSSTGASALAGGASVGILNVNGNFQQSAGELRGTAGSSVNFTGSGVQIFTGGGGFGTTAMNSANFSIAASSIFDMGTSALTGLGNLTVSGTLRVGSTDAGGAIQTGLSNGNVRVGGVRTYNTGSLIIYNGSGAQFMGSGHPLSTGVNCTISNSAGVTLASDVTVAGVLTLGTGNLSLSSHTLTLNGSFVPNANSLVVSSASSIAIGGAGPFGTLVTTGSSTINNFSLNRTSSGTVILGADLGIGGTFTQTVGDVVLNGRTLTLSGPYSRTNGSLAIDAACGVVINGTGALPGSVAFSAPQQINTLTLNRSGETLGTSSNIAVTNLNLLAGTFNNTGTIVMAAGGVLTRTEGSIINNTPSAVTTYDVVYNVSTDVVTGSEIPTDPTLLVIRNVTKNGSANLSFDQSIVITGNLTINNGTIISGANSIELRGNFAANSASNLDGSTFIFAGTSTISGIALLSFDLVTINSGATVTLSKDINVRGNFQNNGTVTPGSQLVTFTGNTTLSGSSTTSFNRVTITGTLTAPAAPGSFNVAGNWTNNGTFNNNNSSVSFTGNTAILGSAQSNFFNLTIAGSSSLTGSSGTFGVAGNFVNNGTFNANGGTVLFNGTVQPQTISGSALTFQNITVSNGASPGVQIANTSRLNGTLTLNSGAFFDADGPSDTGVFIISSTSQTAGGRIATLPNPNNFVGQVTVERFVHGKSGGDYRYLSMPITSNATVAVWRNSIFVTGDFSDRNTNSDNSNIQDSGNTNPSIFSFNSGTQTFAGVAGGGGLTSATAISSRIGYSAYNFNNGNVTISYRGNIERGDVPITISGANGNFNLVPNPYPSQIDWDNVVRTNVTNAMYIRVDNNIFSSYVGGVATNPPFGGWTGEVSTGQAFWVVSNGGGTTFTLREADKTGNNNNFLLTAQQADDYFRIALSREGGVRDEIVLRFADNATDTFDAEFDALKLTNFALRDPTSGANPRPFFNLASYLPGSPESFAINTVARLNSAKIVNLSVSDVEPGEYKLDFSDMYLLKSGYQVVLVDTYENQEFDVSDGFQYAFTVTTNKLTFGRDRFYLRINGDAARETSSLNFGFVSYPNPTSDILYVDLPGEAMRELSEISLSTTMGGDVARRIPTENEKSIGQLQIDLTDRSPGLYLLSLNFRGLRQVVKVVKK